MSETTDVDKDALFGRYQNDEDWRTKLNKRLRHKALDIPMDDDVNVKNTTMNTGFGWKELAVLAAMGLGGGGLYAWSNRDLPAPSAESVKATAEAEFRFWQRKADGTLVPVDIERLPPELRPKQ